MEDIGKIINNGFETYLKNLNLGIPFFINVMVTGILAAVMFLFGAVIIFGQSLSRIQNVSTIEDVFSIVFPLIIQHRFEIMILVITYFLIAMFFQTFFTAGAIGMAQQATETGKTDLSTMLDAGKKNVVNLFLAEILVGLLYLTGIVFMVPGIMKSNLQVSSSPDASTIALILGGVFIWFIYILVLSLILAIYRYSLVVEKLGPVDGITSGVNFFKVHKLDVFILWLLVAAIVFVLMIIGQIVGLIPIINLIWPIISILVSTLVIAPLTTLWWVRMYMSGTDKKLYFNELLAHPDEIEKFNAN